MGCCMSTGGDPLHRENQHSPGSSAWNVKAAENRAPPPSTEEETVKEVVSSVSVAPPPKPLPDGHRREQEDTKSSKPTFGKTPNDERREEKKEAVEEASDLSDLCSVSESVSTIAAAENREPEYWPTAARQVPTRSPAKPSPIIRPNRSRDLRGGLGSGRISDHSPGRRNPTPARVVQTEPGESSRRRSRSPATRVYAYAGRSPSAKRTHPPPGRTVRNPPAPGNSSFGNEETAESLENPLVSLECFIFL